MPPRIIPIEEWRGYGWSGLPFQQHPALGIVLHHAVIEPSGDIVADLNLVDRIHQANLGGFAYTLGSGYGAEGDGRGPYIGAHTYAWNDKALGYCFLTDGRYHSLSYPEIEAFRWQRQQWLASGWIVSDHFTIPHGWMPQNSTACCGPLIIDQLHDLLMPYEGSFEEAPPMATPATFRAMQRAGDPTGQVWATNGAVRFRILDPEHWNKLVTWGLVLNFDVVQFRQAEFDLTVDSETLARFLANPPSSGGAGGGATPAQVQAVVRGELDRTKLGT